MSTVESTTVPAKEAKNIEPRFFFLDIGAGRILSANPEGSDLKVVIGGGLKHPDGLAIDPVRGHLYWTNMGNPIANDGSICRCDLDGGNITVIVSEGSTFTPKQLQIDAKNQKLYWCDREGMRVMRSNLDGSNVETLLRTGETDADRKDQTRWCVGIAVDAEQGKIYWTQIGADNAGQGRIFRAGIDIPAGEGPATRTDVELLFANLPEPVDLDLDPANRMLYWTDRGDPPRGNTVNRASIDVPANPHTEPEILIHHLMEGIGLTLDLKHSRMFVTDLAGTVYRANLDGSNSRTLMVVQGNLTGIAYLD
jgi:DNA-binding beta-propeller fold protein YncE